MKNLTINKKVFVSIILFIAVQILSAYLFYKVNDTIVQFAKKEILGNDYQKTLMKILVDLNSHKASNERYELGFINSNEELSIISESIDRGFAELKTKGPASIGLKFTTEELAARGRANLAPNLVEANWRSLKTKLATTKASELEADYNTLADKIKGMILHTGDTSNLILDPDLDSYYMMDVTLLAIPQMIDRLSKISSYVLPIIKRGSKVTRNEAIQIENFKNFLQESDISRIVADYDTIYKEDGNFFGISPTLKANSEKALKEFTMSNNYLIKTLTKLSNKEVIQYDDFNGVMKQSREKTFALWNISSAELDNLLGARINSYKGDELRNFVINVVCLILSLVIFYLIINSVTKPLAELVLTINRVANREYNFIVNHKDRSDEIGQMAKAIDAVRLTAQKVDSLEKLQKDEEARKVRGEKLEKLLEDFNTKATFAITVVANAATELYETSENMVGIVSDASNKSSSMVQTSAVVSNNVNSVAVAAEEMTASIQEISKQVGYTNNAVDDAISQSSGALETGKKLHDASNAIGSIIKLIDEIAEQINLLALNATIESARAGEAGKGFAVVASEIKNLADQTTKATENIVEHIGKIKTISKQVSEVFEVVNGSIGKLKNYASGISHAVEEQAQATNEIAVNMSTAADDVKTIRSNIEVVSSSNKNAEDSTLQVIQASRMLSEQSEKLKMEVEVFIKRVGELKG